MTAEEIERRFTIEGDFAPVTGAGGQAALGLIRARVCQLAFVVNDLLPRDTPSKERVFCLLEQTIAQAAAALGLENFRRETEKHRE